MLVSTNVGSCETFFGSLALMVLAVISVYHKKKTQIIRVILAGYCNIPLKGRNQPFETGVLCWFEDPNKYRKLKVLLILIYLIFQIWISKLFILGMLNSLMCLVCANFIQGQTTKRLQYALLITPDNVLYIQAMVDPTITDETCFLVQFKINGVLWFKQIPYFQVFILISFTFGIKHMLKRLAPLHQNSAVFAMSIFSLLFIVVAACLSLLYLSLN